ARRNFRLRKSVATTERWTLVLPLAEKVFSFMRLRIKLRGDSTGTNELIMAINRTLTATARSGVLAGGNWIIDQVKLIDVYPQPEQLANIRSQAQGTGGAPYNVLVDLARLGVSFPLFAAGLVGRDALGQRILEDCRKRKI